MNNNDFLNGNSTANKYRATRNLNTEIENPEMNINSAIGVNIKDIAVEPYPSNETINNYFNSEINTNEIAQNINFQTQNSYDSAINYTSPNSLNYNTNDINQSNNYGLNQTSIFINNSNDSNITSQVNDNFTTDYTNDKESSNNYVPTGDNGNYKPTLKEKKKPTSLQIPNELKVMVFIVFLLLLFIIIVPYVFDFVKEIELRLTR